MGQSEALSMSPSDQHLASLRRRIAAGHYAVNAHNVAGTIVRKLREVNRARRALGDVEGDRTPTPGEPSHRGPEAQRPRRGSSSR